MTQQTPAPPDPEEFEEAAPVDPTPQRVDEYQKLVEENAPEHRDGADLTRAVARLPAEL